MAEKPEAGRLRQIHDMKRSKLLKHPTIPFELNEKRAATEALTAMSHTAFQARNLATAVDVWGAMLKGRTSIFLGLAGAMVPAGMRSIITYLIQNRMIDCLVSTGANLFHDIHESLGRFHFQGNAHMDDVLLQQEGVDRTSSIWAFP